MGGERIRIGNTERNAAMAALDEHLRAGRLDAEEYGERYAIATSARTREELDALFTDLPEPHVPAVAPAPAPAPPATKPSPVAVERAGDVDAASSALGGRYGAMAVAVAPFVALALFFLTNAWVWFLLIPAAGAVVYGGRGGRDGRRGRSNGRGP